MRGIVGIGVLFGLLTGAGAVAAPPLPAPPVNARAYVLIETRTNTELLAANADERLPPASLTKLMTAYLVFSELRAGRLHRDDPVKVSRYAAHLPGARMFLLPDEVVSVDNLLKGMLVDSGNDAAFALVERVAGDLPTFVARMNAEAARLGLRDTHFANATGLPNRAHYSTARDLAHLAAALRRDFPEYHDYFAQREFTWAGITQPNRNLLLGRVPGVDGLKTGHTEAAGYCLVASAEREPMQLIAAALGIDSATDRLQEGRALLEYGFHAFETRRLYAAGESLVSAPVSLGATDRVALGPSQDLWLTLRRGDFERLDARALLSATPPAPIARGVAMGELRLTLDQQPVATVPLTTLGEVPEGSIARRAGERLRRWLRAGGEAQAAPQTVTLGRVAR